MSIVIALIVMIVVGMFISKYYPKPNKTIVVAPEETKVEVTPEPTVVIEPLVETTPIITTKPSDEAAKMSAKPKKKKPHHKKPAKKPNA